VLVEAEYLLAQQARQQKGAGERQQVYHDTADANVSNLRERQAKAVQNNPQPQ